MAQYIKEEYLSFFLVMGKNFLLARIHLDVQPKLYKKRCYKQILDLKKKDKKKIKFVSDKLAHYKTTHNKMFRNVTDITHGIPIKAKQKGLKYNNNVIECEHLDVNQRIKQMRGVEDIDFV